MSTDGGETDRTVQASAAYKRDLKRLSKRGKDLDRLDAVVETIRLGRRLNPRHRDHALSGEMKDFRDCHVETDWVLIYRVDDEAVYLTRTGTHADLLE
jgi:mRNA interferase YafQ